MTELTLNVALQHEMQVCTSLGTQWSHVCSSHHGTWTSPRAPLMTLVRDPSATPAQSTIIMKNASHNGGSDLLNGRLNSCNANIAPELNQLTGCKSVHCHFHGSWMFLHEMWINLMNGNEILTNRELRYASVSDKYCNFHACSTVISCAKCQVWSRVNNWFMCLSHYAYIF